MEMQNKAPVDWSNGNVIDTMIFGVILYSVFLLSAKMRLMPNLLLYTVLFGVYLLNTQRLYWKNRELISEEQDEKYMKHINLALITSAGIFIFGVIDYLIYEKMSYGNKFNIVKF